VVEKKPAHFGHRMKDSFESDAHPARTPENMKKVNKTIAHFFMWVNLSCLLVYGQSIKQKVSIYDLPVSTIATGRGGIVYGNGVQKENQDDRTPGRSLSVPVVRV